MDINLPGASGVEATPGYCLSLPATAVLVVSMVDDDDSIFAALAAGARGYVLKGASAGEITAALRTVAAGGAVFGPGIASRLLATTSARLSGAAPSSHDDLTAREREVLGLLADGASNRQIARALGISLKTVQNHVSASSTSCRPQTAPRPPCASGASRRRRTECTTGHFPSTPGEAAPTIPDRPAGLGEQQPGRKSVTQGQLQSIAGRRKRPNWIIYTPATSMPGSLLDAPIRQGECG